jgi:predicted DNA-binding transcriptional regulator YafY
MARTARLLELLQILRGKSQPVTAASLAASLSVSERTLYRDIAELIAQGAPIYGEAGIGYVLRPGLFLPPLMLSEAEVEAVVLGLRYVDQRGDEVLSKASASASAKIAAVLSPAAKEAMRNPIALPGPAGWGYPDNAVPLAAFRDAIRAQAKLCIAYQAASGDRTERTVWPLAIGFMNEARVLVAWCEARQDYRTFRTDRIGAASQTGARYPGRRNHLLGLWRRQATREAAGQFAPDKN